MTWSRSFRRALTVPLAVSLTMMLAACAGSTQGKVEVRRDLPQFPSWGIPVTVPQPKAGDDPLVIAARERAGRGEANRRITALGQWYGAVRAEYAGEKPK
ncbi:hypothetical protein ACUSIJ_28810 [Pseudochelatococcus sp. B33]